jgi:hypothetical protein
VKKKPKKDAFGRALDALVRAMKRGHPSLGMYACYPTEHTASGAEVAVVVALGDHAKRVGRWVRRSHG